MLVGRGGGAGGEAGRRAAAAAGWSGSGLSSGLSCLVSQAASDGWLYEVMPPVPAMRLDSFASYGRDTREAEPPQPRTPPPTTCQPLQPQPQQQLPEPEQPPAQQQPVVPTAAAAEAPAPAELALLAKLEEANRLIEADSKSLNSLSGNSQASGHSRKSSDTSQISLTSGMYICTRIPYIYLLVYLLLLYLSACMAPFTTGPNRHLPRSTYERPTISGFVLKMHKNIRLTSVKTKICQI